MRAKTRPRVVIVPFLFLVLAGCISEDPGLTEPEVRREDAVNVLFIGNSLTYFNSLPEMLTGLFALGGAGEFYTESATYGGVGLVDHWDQGAARPKIAAGGWDVVVLQQGPSATEGRPSLLDFAARFDTEIRAIGATTALYMVWPEKRRFFDFPGVSDSYATAAENVDGILFPAGDAWLLAWEADPDLALYGPDNFHPSVLGTYLAALVMYEKLSGLDPRDLPETIPTPGGAITLSSVQAALLQEAAVKANAKFAK